MKKYHSGNDRQQEGFKSFIPSSVNVPYEWEDERIVPVLAEAMHALGELDAYSQILPDSDAFIEMYIAKEAVNSSRIEGTKTNIEEAILPLEEVSQRHRSDWQEVRNYISALRWAADELKTIPLSTRLLKGAHRILMESVRGEHKQPGEVRMSQNWIGGATPATARYVPPPFADVPDLLSDLERSWHNSTLTTPVLIRTAISHYQFETIHPFLDGNGRVGRLLTTLHLMHAGLLTKPTLYLSAFLEEQRQEYFDRLDRVRTHGEMDAWILFFLTGVSATASDALMTMRKITDLKKRYEEQIISSYGKRTEVALKLLHHLFSHPTVQVKDAIVALSITKPSAGSLVDQFVASGFLKETTGQKKDRIFSMQEYVALFGSSSL